MRVLAVAAVLGKVWLTRYANSQEDRSLQTQNKRETSNNCRLWLPTDWSYDLAVLALNYAAPIDAKPKHYKT